MPPLTPNTVITGTDSPASPSSAVSVADMNTSTDAGRKLYNLPSRSEKLTDSTLPLSWPVAYLETMKAADASPADDGSNAYPTPSELTPLAQAHDDYAQLMRKLQAESAVVQGRTSGDKALCAAHYIATLIAALAFLAMMGIVLLNFFPVLAQA